MNEIVTPFSRVDYDHTLGYLNGGLAGWKTQSFDVNYIGSVSVAKFTDMLAEGSMEKFVNVRRESEYLSEHVLGVENFPLNLIHSNFAEIDPDKEYFLHYKTRYRSLIAISTLKANGVKVSNERGGYEAIK